MTIFPVEVQADGWLLDEEDADGWDPPLSPDDPEALLLELGSGDVVAQLAIASARAAAARAPAIEWVPSPR